MPMEQLMSGMTRMAVTLHHRLTQLPQQLLLLWEVTSDR